jgi:oxygen-independent coproporphyrinogen-3 oxidase
MALQLKRGFLDGAYFRDKFQVNIFEHWRESWDAHAREGFVQLDEDRVRLTRKGLLRVDSLLPAFFETQHQGVRYT